LWEQVQASVMQHSSTVLEWDYPMVTCGTYISPSCARLLATVEELQQPMHDSRPLRHR
jgi:hypothetical protein